MLFDKCRTLSVCIQKPIDVNEKLTLYLAGGEKSIWHLILELPLCSRYRRSFPIYSVQSFNVKKFTDFSTIYVRRVSEGPTLSFSVSNPPDHQGVNMESRVMLEMLIHFSYYHIA